MTDSALSLVERQVDDVTVLVLTGQILLDDGDLLYGRTIRDLVDRGRVKIVLDLAGVTYIDSSGVGMLVGKPAPVRDAEDPDNLRNVLRRGRGCSQLRCPPKQVSRDLQCGVGVPRDIGPESVLSVVSAFLGGPAEVRLSRTLRTRR